MLLQVVRQPTEEEMLDFVGSVRSRGLNREEARQLRSGKPDRAIGFTYRYAPESGSWALAIKFKKSKVSKSELKEVLSEILENLDS